MRSFFALIHAARLQLPMLCAFAALTACYSPERMIALDGTWRWRAGFDAAWLSTAERGADWQSAPLAELKLSARPELQRRAGWITLELDLPPEFDELARAHGSLALYSGLVSDVSIFYLNGVEIGRLGSVEPYRSGSYNRLLADIPPAAVKPDAPDRLAVALYSNGVYPYFFADSDMRAGAAGDLYAWYYRAEIISIALLSVYFVVGLYHLLLFVRRRSDLHNLYFGIFCTVVSLYWLFRTGSRDLVFANYIDLRIRMEYIALFALGPLLIQFLAQFFYQRHSRFGLAYGAFCAALALLVLFGGYELNQTALSVWQLSAAPLLIAFVIYIMVAIYRGRSEGWYILGGMLLLTAAGIHDVLAARGVLDGPHIARFTFVAFILGIAGLLAARFMRVHNEVEELNSSLERKVEERTRQLQHSLNEVRALKVQQDGDYFLTSLLIKPLGGNFVKSEHVDIDMLVRQKKRFQFRHWEAEIGGDLCTAHSIQLGGRRYSAFLNGDAMGKSIQGAGGALVLGTVFKSVVSRTQYAPGDESPELWLKNCFVELQNIFVSFDGSMLISAVLGLIDDESGMLYFINAEHPWIVLYREGRANFIEDRLILRKIGIEALSGRMHISAFALEPGDVVIVGSDGRDDIQLGVDAKGNRIINEDEYEFLRHVESGAGDLEKIEASILGRGDLTDDFTLIRVGYRVDESLEFLQRRKDERERLAKQIGAALEAGEAGPGLTALEQYFAHFPESSEHLFAAARLARASGRLAVARDYAERLRLREPRHVANLITLAELCLALGDLERAEKIAGEALEIEPANARARELAARRE